MQLSLRIYYFYTDVYGLSAAAAGTMFLVVRAIDALADPFIGAMVDRTNSRFGRFRPYLVRYLLPFLPFFVLRHRIFPKWENSFMRTSRMLVYRLHTRSSMFLMVL